MPDFPWKDWLTRYSQVLLAALDPAEYSGSAELDLTPERLASGWLGFPGVSDDQLASLEARLGLPLPPSYRQFLSASNGFLQPGQFVPRLFSSDEAGWLRDLDPATIEDWNRGAALAGPLPPVPDEDYFVYGRAQDSAKFRLEYLPSTLLISAREEAGTAVYLLNPQVVNKDGEWEAWLFAHWLPGANRYRSFWELMQAEQRSFQAVQKQINQRFKPGDSPQAFAAKLADLQSQLRRQIRQYGSFTDPNPIAQAPTHQYNQGVVDGLRLAEEGLRQIQSMHPPPSQARQQLRDLAADLEGQARRGWQASRGVSPVADVLAQGLSAMLAQIHDLAVPEGCRQAAALIRWFLNEADHE